MDTRSMVVAIAAILAGLVVLLGPVACTMRRHAVIAEAIKAGSDPIATRCAMESDVLHTPVCVIAAQRK
jgi:hypothetical protein